MMDTLSKAVLNGYSATMTLRFSSFERLTMGFRLIEITWTFDSVLGNSVPAAAVKQIGHVIRPRTRRKACVAQYL